jgi:hypothetical protein
MAKAHLLRNNFTSGELSPIMLGRSDHPRYANGLAIQENWQTLSQGGLRRRPGTRYVGASKYPNRLAILLTFEASLTDVYVLEVGHEYLWIYKDGARLSAIELTTPYQESELRQLRTAQANDILFLTHPSYAVRRLARLSDTSWTLTTVRFDPPATYEAGHAGVGDLTPSATTGPITLTSTSSSAFLEADVTRQIQTGTARLLLTALTSGSVVTARVLDPLSSTDPIPASDWRLLGSPGVECKPSAAGPIGKVIDLDLQAVQDTEAELVTNGTFATDTDWTDYSAPTVATGTTDTVGTDTALTDTGATFLSAGVEIGHIAYNTTDSAQDRIEGVPDDTTLVTAEGGAGWDTGKAYTIRQTGISSISNNALSLHGQENGLAWREQILATVTGRRYRWQFDVVEQSVSAQVGSASTLSDVVSEQSYVVGNEHVVVFTATSTTTALQFRNNQDYAGKVANVSCKLYSAEGWRSVDDNQWVYINGGLCRILSITDATKARAMILAPLTSDDAAAAGAWSLESQAWSSTLGWPRAILFQGGRMILAGSATFSQTVWMSESDGLINFFHGVNPDDAVVLHLTQSGGNITLNQILWALPSDRLVVGTSHAEYSLVGANEDAITPTNQPTVRQGNTLGSTDAVAPLLLSRSILMVQRQGSKVWELQFNPQTEKFDARDVTILSSHLLASSRHLVQWAYQQEPINTVWSVRSDGQLLSLTYDLVENVIAWARHTLGGNGAVESVCTLPDQNANQHQVWLLVRRTIDGQTVRHLEYFETQHPTEPLTGQVGCHLDSAVISDVPTPSTTVSGLEHLEGETIQVVGDGALFADLVVSGGQVTLDFATSTRIAGLPYIATARPLPPDIPQLGTIRARQKRWNQLTAILDTTIGLQIAGARMPLLRHEAPAGQGLAPFTGAKAFHPLGWDEEGQYDIVADLPYPATVLAVVGELDVDTEG